MALEESFNDYDFEVINGVKVILQSPVDEYLSKSTLDYRQTRYYEGFYFTDAVVSSC